MITVDQAQDKVLLTNQKITSVVNDFKILTEARITFNNTRLVEYVNLLYQRAHFSYLQGLFHASPGLFAVLAAIWGVLVTIYGWVVIIIDIFKIKELLQLAEILKILWPQFRKKYNEILGKVSEFSKQIGWGADGLIHLIQAAQGGLNILKGVTGKSFEWLQVAGAEKALRSLAFVSSGAYKIAADPASVLDIAFNIPYEETSREVGRWWDKTIDWLDKTAKTAEEAAKKVNDTLDRLLELENNMPDIIRYFLPSWIGDGIKRADSLIDNTILPALTSISHEFTQINAQLEAERQRAAELAEQLSHPGDMLLRVEGLQEAERIEQQRKMDEAVSAQFARDVEAGKQANSGIIAAMQVITDALKEPPPSLSFLTIEDMKLTLPALPGAVIYSSWNIDDFVATA